MINKAELEEKFDRVRNEVGLKGTFAGDLKTIDPGFRQGSDWLKPLFLEVYEALRLIEIHCQDVEARAKAELTTGKVDAFLGEQDEQG